MIGECQYREQKIGLHYWIDLTGALFGYCIDYCLQMWLGIDDGIPYGVFRPRDFGNILYKGAVAELSPLPDGLVEILIMPF